MSQDAGGESLNMSDVMAVPGVQMGAFSTAINPVASFAWGTNTSFPDQKAARTAFLNALSNVSKSNPLIS